MAGTIIHPDGDGSYSARGAPVAYRSASCWPAWEIPAEIESRFPRAGLWVPGAYASVWDLILISLPVDAGNDFTNSGLQRWLTIGAARINEHLGQRGWPVPLTAWSETVVWANCEIAYIGAARQRGLNTEANLGDFRAREENVSAWLTSARDRQITPDQRPSDAGLGTQAIGYRGPLSRGWDADPRSVRGRGGRGW